MSSGTEVRGGDTSPRRQPRQNRIHSVGLPVPASLAREPSTTGSPAPLPIPRRHSATPTVAPPPIPLRPPAIPKRCKNEKPIPIRFPTTTGQKGQVDRGKRSNDTRTPANDAKPALPTSRDNSANEELIDLGPAGPCRTRRQVPDRPKANCDNRQPALNSAGPEENEFVADFDELGFAADSQKSNFEQLQRASRDLEKMLHERTAEPEFKDYQRTAGQRRASTNAQTNGLQSSKTGKDGNVDSRDDTTDAKSREKIIPPRGKEALQEDENKFAALMKMRRETEKRCKFEELQAASKKLETRLHEEDGDDEQEEEEGERVQETEEEKAPSSLGTNKEKPVVDSRFEELRRASQELERRLRLEQRSTATVPRGKYEIDTDRARNIQQQQNLRKERTCEKLEKLPKATQTNLPPPLSAISQTAMTKPVSVRQDSNVSSDSFSQTSSPSYTSKTMEAPLLPHKYGKVPDRALVSEPDNASGRTITKSTSTPASLQTIVRVHGNGTGSLRHKIIRDMTNGHYVTTGRLRFRFVQVLFNAVALLIIAGGLAIYVRSYPETVIPPETKLIYANKVEITERAPVMVEDNNPAPGVCLPIIVTFCQYHKIPYNFTVFPNYIGNYGQHDAQQELELYGSVINVRCYELAALFLCTVFVPKCGSQGHDVRPCRSLCSQTKRRCGFFLGVFGLNLLDYLECDQFPENSNPDECVGHREVQEAARRAERPVCTSGFQCDENICIPVDWRCDGHVDCKDRTDEKGCGNCTASSSPSVGITSKIVKKPILAKNTNVESVLHCGERRCMSANDICDGVMNCPWGQDERYCLRLSQKNGDVGEGRLEVYHAEMGKFMPACVAHWDSSSPKDVCAMLGYTAVVSSRVEPRDANVTRGANSTNRRPTNLLKNFQECITDQERYPTAELICTEYACGRRKTLYGNSKVQTRIVGGVESSPGDWPFLAAVLGGPEQIFYCAGVLIADQWILTASHCVGNHTDVTGWTIQLGITRRHSHTFLGQKLKVKRVIPHPNYNVGSDHDNDVALFQLERRVEFHEHLRPVCLPSPETRLVPGTLCTVIGWGKKNDIDTSEYEPAVNEVQVPVLKREICSLWLEHSSKLNVTDGMICAGYPDGGKDACQGDSGGPLLCQDDEDKEKWIVGGIVSWGIKCAHPKLPGVYAYVPKYVPWIRREMHKYSDVSMG